MIPHEHSLIVQDEHMSMEHDHSGGENSHRHLSPEGEWHFASLTTTMINLKMDIDAIEVIWRDVTNALADEVY